jgi:nitroreductase
MDVLEAIRTRRTVKSYGPEPVEREVLERVLEAARWAPNHRLTEPWRFRVLGPQSLAALKVVAGEGGGKLDMSPTVLVASFVPSALPAHAVEDEHASAAAIYAVLLAATAEGLASFWRTPAFVTSEAGRAAIGLPDAERVLGIVCLGPLDGDAPEPPARGGLDEYVTWLD